MPAPDFSVVHEVVELLQEDDQRETADLILRMADWINHLTNVNDGLRETLDEQRAGLAELRAMLAEQASA